MRAAVKETARGYVSSARRYPSAEAARVSHQAPSRCGAPGSEQAADEKMRRLAATLREQQAEGAWLDGAISANPWELGNGG